MKDQVQSQAQNQAQSQAQSQTDARAPSETVLRARQEDQHNNIALGLALFVIGIFGMLRQLDSSSWAHGYEWFDAIIVAAGLGAMLHTLLRRAPFETLGDAILTSGTLAYRQDLLVLNVKVIFFGLILFTAVGMMIRGMRGESS